MKNNYSNKIIFSIVILTFIHLILSFKYQVSDQHDTWLHHFYLFYVMTFKFSQIHSEYGMVYYFFVSLFSIFTSPFYFLHLITDKEAFYLTIKISNFFLYILTIKLSFELFKKYIKDENILLFTIIIFFCFSPIQRTFLMARPENLMIVCTLLFFISYINLALVKENKKKNLIYAITSIAILSSQKVTGLVFSIFILVYLFLFCKNLRENNLLILKYSFSITICYFFIHYVVTGIPFYETSDFRFGHTEQLGIINSNVGLDIYYNFNPLDAFNRPIRDYQHYSMFNILFLDFFGDYWNHGIFRSLIGFNKHELFLKCQSSINRYSLVTSIFFVILFFYSIFNILTKENFKKSTGTSYKILNLLFLLPFFGIALLIAAGITRLPPTTGSIFKWEYISFCLFPLSLIISYNLEKNISKKNKKYFISLLIILITIAIYQNLYFIRC